MKEPTAWLASFVVAAAAGAWCASCLSLPTVEEFASGVIDPGKSDTGSGDASLDQDSTIGPDASQEQPSDASAEEPLADADDSGGEAGDALMDGSTLKKIGEACTSTSECDGKLFCMPTGSASVIGTCTMSCCTSAYCPPDFVCRPEAAGAVCVSAAKLGLTLAIINAGEPCSDPWQCRSGRCESGLCADTCCSDANCATNACSLVNDGTSSTWQCAKWSSGHDQPGGATCTSHSECESNYCRFSVMGSVCSAPCCGTTQCADASTNHCMYMMEGSVAVRQCTNSIFTSAKPCCTTSDCEAGKTCIAVQDSVPTGTGNKQAWVLTCQ
ncbi:MAG: hypothetical protein HY898_00635 [Deltaproteobacteria bacterium]|nr:hypothetical protein [Deltaproteobacteria bacterium]